MLFLLLMVVVIMIGCTERYSGKPNIHGYVIDVSEKKILVISKVAQDFSDTGGISNFYDAIWLSKASKDIEVGQEVRVWYDGPVEESYPAGGTVGKIEIVKKNQPETANINESKAIQLAIQQLGSEGLIAINSVTFDGVEKRWKVTYEIINMGIDKDSGKQMIEIDDSVN